MPGWNKEFSSRHVRGDYKTLRRFSLLIQSQWAPSYLNWLNVFSSFIVEGRMVTRASYLHFGIKPPERVSATLQLFEDPR